ncbi:MAG: GTP-binding protein [Microcoleus sp. SIO2G3]|nr:GTP-binding protein [Microcoleus sp. SIO2G3]
MPIISKKLCIIGDFGVGKTSLIRRYVDRQFSDQYLSTVGVKISRKLIDSLQLQLLIWDIEGSTKFKAIAPAYLQGAKGAIVVGDVTRPETIDHLVEHVQSFLLINPQSFVSIALNKADLVEDEKVEYLARSIELQNQSRVIAIEPTSAKTGDAVDRMFETLGLSFLQ